MTSNSTFPDVEIPDADIWGFTFERKDRDFPDDKVIYRAVDSDRKHTFADVKSHATLFGEGLRNLWDWQKNDVLALYAPNDVDFSPVIYGTFFAGGIVTPANPSYSKDELAYQLENSEAKALVTTKALMKTALEAAKKVGIASDRVVLLGAGRDETHQCKHWTSIRKTSSSARYRRRKADPQDVAFLAYSSGTTGLPKGVMLTHRNIVSNILVVQGGVGRWYSSAEDKFLGILPFFHLYGLTALVHQVMHRGIELIVMPAFDLKTFLKAIQEHRITYIYVAPPVIVRLSRDSMAQEYDLSSVKMITCGAAPLTHELVETVYAKLKLKVNQAYGLSETSAMTHAQPWDEWQTHMGSVGKLLPNLSAKLISPDGTTLDPSNTNANTPGELLLRGPSVFTGYWKNPTATASSFTSDGFFRTGDIGYQDAHGNFHITDRVKELIKYKGFQVAPAELEGKLMQNELVNDVAVIGVLDEEMHTEVPRAYVVPSQPRAGEKEARSIVQWMQANVAKHKWLRGGVVFVDEVPKSASGKILRRVLKERAKGDVGLGIGGSVKARL